MTGLTKLKRALTDSREGVGSKSSDAQSLVGVDGAGGAGGGLGEGTKGGTLATRSAGARGLAGWRDARCCPRHVPQGPPVYQHRTRPPGGSEHLGLVRADIREKTEEGKSASRGCKGTVSLKQVTLQGLLSDPATSPPS